MFDLGTAVGYLMLDTSGLESGFRRGLSGIKGFMDSTNSMSDRLTGIGSAMTSVGGTLTKSLTLPLVGAGTALGLMATQFENAMAKVSTIADTTQVPLGELESAILDLSNETGIAAADIADNVYNAISAGQKTADAVSFVENATKLSVAGFTSSASSLDILTTALNSYGLAAEEVTRVSDVLITTQNLGKTTVDELAASMGRVIPIAKSNNVSLEELGATYAILTANGINTAETTTYIKSMLNELGKAGTGVSDILKEETGKSFQQLLEDGSSLGDIISILGDYASEAGLSLSDLFGSVEAGTAALTLAGKGADAYNDILKQMQESSGATELAFEKMQTTSMTIRKAWNQLKNSGIELGSVLMGVLAPVIESLANGISTFSHWFEGLNDTTKELIVKFGLFAAALGPVLLIAGKLVAGFVKLKALFASLPVVFTALSGPIGIVVAAIGALAVAWATDFAGIQEVTSRVFESIRSILESTVSTIVYLAESFLALFKGLWESNFLGISTFIQDTWNIIVELFSGVFETIALLFEAFALLFQNDWEGAWNKILEVFVTVWQTIAEFFGNVLLTLVNLLVNIGASLWIAAKGAFEQIKQGFTVTWDSIKSWFELAKEDPVKAVLSIGTSLYNAGANVFTELWNGLKSVWDSIVSWVENAMSWLASKVNIWNSTKSSMQSDMNGFSGTSGFYASGLDYVPRDMTVRVHEGEAILTKEQNRYRTDSGGDTYNLYSPVALTPTRAAREIRKLKQQLAEGMV